MKFLTPKVLIYIFVAIVLLVIILNWHSIFPKKPVKVLPPVPTDKAVGKASTAGAAVEVVTPNGTTTTVTATGTGKTGMTGVDLDGSKVLALGSKGAEVLELQHLMNQYDTTVSTIEDGVFGNVTLMQLGSLAGVQSITLNDAWQMFAGINPDSPLGKWFNFLSA